MTAKIDGTNGLIQQYDYQTPTTGFSYTFAAGTTVLVMNPAGTLATGTITMPAAPADGMTITFSSTQTITALTVSANTGQSIVSAATVLPARQATTYVYRLSNTTWYPMSTVATNVPTTPAGGSTIQTSTVNAGGANPFNNTLTAVDFTGIPSWVKRITVIFNETSLSASAGLLVQIGSGSVTNTGYIGTGNMANQSNNAVGISAISGFPIYMAGTTYVFSGAMTIYLISGNTYIANHSGKSLTNAANFGGGSVTLLGVLDRVRITSTSTDTFDAGSINIFYE